MKDGVGHRNRALWKHQVKYLGAKITSILEVGSLVAPNVNPMIKETQRVFFEKCQALGISWFGKIAVVKMKILPKFTLPQCTLRKIQVLFSKFGGGGGRINQE